MSYINQQLCVHFYIKTRAIIRFHEKMLRDELELTYPSALVLLTLDEKKICFVEEVSKQLCLDTGTLTPLLKKLQARGYINRLRQNQDERRVSLSLTSLGQENILKIKTIFDQTAQKMNLSPESKKQLLYLLKSINLNNKDIIQ